MLVGLFRRFGFAAVVVVGLGADGRSSSWASRATDAVFGRRRRGQGCARGQAAGPGGPGGGAPTVLAVAAGMHTFTDGLQAIGTAQARESIVLTPKVADTIRRIRFESGDRVRARPGAGRDVERRAGRRSRRSARRQPSGAGRSAPLPGIVRPRLCLASAPRHRARRCRRRRSARSTPAARALPTAPSARRSRASSACARRAPANSCGPAIRSARSTTCPRSSSTSTCTETQIARVTQGVELVARTAAYPDRTFTGTIANVDSRVDPTTRTVRVRAMLPNSDGTLRPGMLMTVRCALQPARSAGHSGNRHPRSDRRRLRLSRRGARRRASGRSRAHPHRPALRRHGRSAGRPERRRSGDHRRRAKRAAGPARADRRAPQPAARRRAAAAAARRKRDDAFRSLRSPPRAGDGVFAHHHRLRR